MSGPTIGPATPVHPITGEPKKTTLEPLEWRPTHRFAHRLELDIIEHEDGDLPVYVSRCKCGWESRPKSQSLARDEWRTHVCDLWAAV